jgi:alkylation response protein AidB-like acyl-CoA dehydrogenase
MDLQQTPKEEQFRRTVRHWLEAHLPAGWGTAAYRAPETPAEQVAFARWWQRTLHDGGWAGITWPAEYGGRGAGIVEQLLYNEEYAQLRAPDFLSLKVGLNLVGPTVMACGTPAQKARFLPSILNGQDIWCQGFSEPNAGSDLASVKTRAEVRGDAFVVSGQKTWTSVAQHADWCILVTRTSVEGPKHKGLTFLLVDMQSPGITIRPLREITGEAWFNEVFFDEVRVPRDNLVGEINGGWNVVLTTLAHERAGTTPHVRLHAAQQRLAALARATARGGRRAADDPIVRQKIAQSAIETAVLRYTAYRNVTMVERTGQPGPEGSVLKIFWSELEQRLKDTAVEILGPYGLLPKGEPRAADDGLWCYELLWSRAATIYAGTSEVQRNIIATRVLGLPR